MSSRINAFFGEELMIRIILVVDELREYAHSRKFWRHMANWWCSCQKVCPNDKFPDIITRWRHLTTYILLSYCITGVALPACPRRVKPKSGELKLYVISPGW